VNRCSEHRDRSREHERARLRVAPDGIDRGERRQERPERLGRTNGQVQERTAGEDEGEHDQRHAPTPHERK
jgi:hypothetical protein